MRFFKLLLAAAIIFSTSGGSFAADDSASPSYQFEFKIAKQRTSRDKKGGAANNATSELWSYKVEVENRSLQDVGALEVKYTCYVSTETRSGGSRKESIRKVSGEGRLDAIARGNRSVLETKSLALKQSEKTEQTKSKNQRGNNRQKKGNTQIKVTEVREKLDGIAVELFLKGQRVGGYVLGDAAKRAAGSKGK